jgi:hypothetical protein
MDFQKHNEEVIQVWDAYLSGKPLRVPMLLTSVPRIWILNPELNTTGITWRQYLNNPQTLFEVALAHRYHVAYHIPQDTEMGIPASQWDLPIEFGNVYEEAWFGCDIFYPDEQIATTRPKYQGGAKYAVFERGMPGPFEGFMSRILETYEFFLDKSQSFEFHGRPIKVGYPVCLGTDGPLTIANGLRGTEIYEDMMADQDYYHQLMDFITEALIQRIKAWRTFLNLDPRPKQGGFADDAVQFLSVKTYREKVLPYHKRFFQALYGEGPHGIHLCGNVQRLLPTFISELNITSFDTGFPVNFNTLRDEVGDHVEIQGGVPAGELVHADPQSIYEKTRAILTSGIMRGGRFILKEANDLAPCTPLANMHAMYTAAREYGKYL